jgi:hypothetical protein
MTTQRILFGEWLPDMPDNTGQETLNLDTALNVYSSTTGYAPFPRASIISEGTADGEDINQLFLAKKDALILAFGGTKKNLYLYNNIISRAAGTEVSKPGGYSNPAVAWQFVSFGDAVLATNGADKIQRYVFGDTGKFADIEQSPICNTIAVVRDFVFAGYCDEDSQKVQWSDLNNETIWDSSDSNQADFQVLPSGGEVKAITGGEFGIILQEKAVTRASYIGTPLVFQFDQISDNTGCLTGKSAIQYNGMTYFLSESGFMVCDGSTIKNIGAGKVNNYFFESLDSTQIETMDVAIDPLKNLIVWNYPTAGRIPTDEERLLIMYNYETGRWTSGSTNSQVVAQLATQTRPLDALDSEYPELETMPVSLDSPLFIGGEFAFCGAIEDKVCTFNLYNEATYLTTSDIEQGVFSVATLAMPIIENGSAAFQIASRNNLNQNIEWSLPSVTSAENRADLRSGGRYHRLRVKPTGAGWTHAIGFDLTITPQGQR